VGAGRGRRAHGRLGSALDGGLSGRRSMTAVTARGGLEKLASAQPFCDPSLALFLLELTCCEFEHLGVPLVRRLPAGHGIAKPFSLCQEPLSLY